MVNDSQLTSYKKLWVVIVIISSIICGFVLWWIYGKEADLNSELSWVPYLPYLNCTFNAATALLLCLGMYFIKKGKKVAHRNTMITAGVMSALFLISYLAYHHFHGDTKFVGQGLIRPIYFFILISHILCTMIQVPLILGTFILAALGKWENHKKVARVTFPIWLYVSVTGVMIFFLLKTFN